MKTNERCGICRTEFEPRVCKECERRKLRKQIISVDFRKELTPLESKVFDCVVKGYSLYYTKQYVADHTDKNTRKYQTVKPAYDFIKAAWERYKDCNVSNDLELQ